MSDTSLRHLYAKYVDMYLEMGRLVDEIEDLGFDAKSLRLPKLNTPFLELKMKARKLNIASRIPDDTPLFAIDMPTIFCHLLSRAGLKTFGDVLRFNETHDNGLMAINGLGWKRYQELCESQFEKIEYETPTIEPPLDRISPYYGDFRRIYDIPSDMRSIIQSNLSDDHKRRLLTSFFNEGCEIIRGVEAAGSKLLGSESGRSFSRIFKVFYSELLRELKNAERNEADNAR